MAEKLIKKIRTSEGDYSIDYTALANKPTTQFNLDEDGGGYVVNGSYATVSTDDGVVYGDDLVLGGTVYFVDGN